MVILRTIDLSTPFTGDTWSEPGMQSPPPLGVEWWRATGPVIWRIIPVDGLGPGAVPVDDTIARVDARLVVIDQDGQGLAMTPLASSCGGELLPLGCRLTDELVEGDVFVPAIPPGFTAGAAPAWRIVADHGAVLL